MGSDWMTVRSMPEFFLGAVRGGVVVVEVAWVRVVEEVMVLQCLM